MKNKDITPPIEIETGLDYKKHDWYFPGLSERLEEFIKIYNLALFNKARPDAVYLALNSLFLWSSDQIEVVVKLAEIQTELDNIKKKIVKGDKTALKEMYNMFLKFNRYFSQVENKPKVNISQKAEHEKFWREENNAGLREMKKAFYDSFMLPED